MLVQNCYNIKTKSNRHDQKDNPETSMQDHMNMLC